MPEVALTVSMLGYIAVALQSLPPGAELRDWWDVVGPALKTVFLAHLSSDCNRPELAEKAMRTALDKLGRGDVAVKLTYPDRVSEVVE
jgi:hypothetical protein